jgi:CheY-like chemotaxis protein
MVGILGYTVIEANGAEPALRILAKYPVALVLTDVVMPGRSPASSSPTAAYAGRGQNGDLTSPRWRHRGALPPPHIVC